MLRQYQGPNEADGTRDVASLVPQVWVSHHYFIDISFTRLQKGQILVYTFPTQQREAV